MLDVSRRLAPLALALVACLVSITCTDAQLRCAGGACQAQASPAANVVEVQGTACTVDPKTSTYPYKVVLVVDVSGSTSQTDPQGGRGRAVQEVLKRYQDNPSVSFAVVTFDGTPHPIQPTFTRDPALLAAAAAQSDQHLGATNYLATLQTVAQIIDQDSKAAPPVDNKFTQYDVQWLSDGNPEIPPNIVDQVTLMQHCSQTRPLVKQAVESLMALKSQDNFYAITLSTIFLDYQPPNPADALVINCQPLINQDPATWGTGADYLQDMATAGMGTFQRLTSANLAFNVKVNVITRRFSQRLMFLTNQSRVVRGDSLLADSDQDGLDDATERALGLDPRKAITDGHVCSDLAAARSSDNPGQCEQICAGKQTLGAGLLKSPTVDADQDGLKACEEAVLLSDDLKPDSNLDGIPDGIALRFDTNLIDPRTGTTDSDLDGASDREEMINGTDPKSAQSDSSLAYQYAPLVDAPSPTAGVSCQTFSVKNVKLVETAASATSQAGDNVLCMQIVQNSVDDPTGQPTMTRACKTVNYRVEGGQGHIDPASATVTFAASDFAVVLTGSPKAN